MKPFASTSGVGTAQALLLSFEQTFLQALPTTRTGLYFCNCKCFAVAGRCEHEQSVHHILGTGDIDLTVVGQQPGKPPLPVPSKRGWSFVALYRAGQTVRRQAHCYWLSAQERATRQLPANLSDAAAARRASGTANASGAAAARCTVTAAHYVCDASGAANLSDAASCTLHCGRRPRPVTP